MPSRVIGHFKIGNRYGVKWQKINADGSSGSVCTQYGRGSSYPLEDVFPVGMESEGIILGESLPPSQGIGYVAYRERLLRLQRQRESEVEE